MKTLSHVSGVAMCAFFLFSASAVLNADTVVRSAPIGVLSATLPKGQSGLAFPLILADTYVATVSGNAAAAVTMESTSSDPRTVLTAGRSYYVEVVTGALEGERFDLDTSATMGGSGTNLALALGGTTHSTLASIPNNALAGSRIAVRPHLTLAALQSMVTPALVGSNKGASADGVRIYSNGEFVRYNLAADGAKWTRGGSNTDFRNLVIPPDASVVLDVASGTKKWVHTGIVRTNAFRKNLIAGVQSFASGFPQDLSFVRVGAFVDPSTPADNRWTGAAESSEADWFEDGASTLTIPFKRYFLREDGTTWQRVNNATNVANATLLDATGMFLLRRVKPDASYVIPVPFAW